MCMFNLTCTNVGVNMVVFMCVMAALLPLVGVGIAVAEARRARQRAVEARDRVRGNAPRGPEPRFAEAWARLQALSQG